MAKLIGPLMSLEARGQFAKTLTYARLGMTSYTKAYKAPTNPQSFLQRAQREIIREITQFWSQLTSDQKAFWSNLAERWELSLYHAYLRFNTERLRDEQTLLAEIVEDTSSPSATEALTVTPDGGDYDIEFELEEPTPYAQHVQIIAAKGSAPTESNKNTILLTHDIPETGLDIYTVSTTWTPPESGTWYFKARWWAVNGVPSDWISP